MPRSLLSRVTSEAEYRYICFCGTTVIGLPVCSHCSRRMVAVLLGEAQALPELIELEGLSPDDDGAKDRIEPVAALAV